MLDGLIDKLIGSENCKHPISQDTLTHRVNSIEFPIFDTIQITRSQVMSDTQSQVKK